ncbi:hypothetical protein OS493_029281 [Desmophyllum pertusum]|uniref:TNFR-Cys domain-containing protein n=1 Tax=Desmophyllum pertusum TaxID=174260 RepID=A0A9W9ZKB9_9CNID|nr:hypothetical protein OS493_029281 [Desmophyllum pertusum]
MKNHIVKKILLLSCCLQSVVGRPIRCSLTTNIVRYDPQYPEVDVECVPCPDCPEGQGLSPQCGSRIPNDSKIECKLCLVNETYSNNHGIESCKPCQECHLKNVIQHCTESQNRILWQKNVPKEVSLMITMSAKNATFAVAMSVKLTDVKDAKTSEWTGTGSVRRQSKISAARGLWTNLSQQLVQRTKNALSLVIVIMTWLKNRLLAYHMTPARS